MELKNESASCSKGIYLKLASEVVWQSGVSNLACFDTTLYYEGLVIYSTLPQCGDYREEVSLANMNA